MDWMEFYNRLHGKFEPFQDNELIEELKRQTFYHPFLSRLWTSVLYCIENKKWLDGAILGFTLFEWAYRMGKYEQLEKPQEKLEVIMKKESMPDMFQSFSDEIRVLRNKFFHLDFDKLTTKGEMGMVVIQ